jgi:hypothetical protein
LQLDPSPIDRTFKHFDLETIDAEDAGGRGGGASDSKDELNPELNCKTS